MGLTRQEIEKIVERHAPGVSSFARTAVVNGLVIAYALGTIDAISGNGIVRSNILLDAAKEIKERIVIR
jgi:hypothetical protein